jgi:hypothetical protein
VRPALGSTNLHPVQIRIHQARYGAWTIKPRRQAHHTVTVSRIQKIRRKSNDTDPFHLKCPGASRDGKLRLVFIAGALAIGRYVAAMTPLAFSADSVHAAIRPRKQPREDPRP